MPEIALKENFLKKQIKKQLTKLKFKIDVMYKIEISNNRKIEDIQDEFNEFFPHLRMEFYSNASLSFELNEREDPTISTYRTNSKNGYLFLHDDLTVENIKSIMFDEFGLLIDIFQKTDINQWSSQPKSEFQLLREIDFEAT